MGTRCSQEPRFRVHRIPPGRRGALVTARLMALLILAGAKDPLVRRAAIGVLQRGRVPAKDGEAEVRALFEWVRRNVRYTRDVFRVEVLHTARRMLRLRAGDCDDMTVLLGALLMSVGHPVRLILAGYRRNRPHQFSHVYLEVRMPGGWRPLDPTIRSPMGTAPKPLWQSVCEVRQERMKCWSRTH